MPHPDALHWDDCYLREAEFDVQRSPRSLVTSHLDLLSPGGRVLDAACGTTSTGIYLAERGWQVIALDVSFNALHMAGLKIRKGTLPISFAVMDLMDAWLPDEHFDAILNFYFLSRPLFSTYQQSLKPGGFLFFETFLRETDTQSTHYLKPQELKLAFRDWEIVHYQEKLRYSSTRHAVKKGRWITQLVARKPK
jgi:tellurite methyltransferase